MTPCEFHQENQKLQNLNNAYKINDAPRSWHPMVTSTPADSIRAEASSNLGDSSSGFCLSHCTFLRKPPPLSLQPCSCMPNVAEWRHSACCFREGMHGSEGEGQPARNSLWLQSEQPAPNARSLSCSLPSKRRSGVGGEPRPFARLTWFGGEPGGEKQGTSIKPEQGTCTFLHKASLRGWKLAQGEGLGHRDSGMPPNDKINTYP